MSEKPQSFREFVKEKARSSRPTSLTLPDAFSYLEELAELAARYAGVRANRAADNLCQATGQSFAKYLKEIDGEMAALKARIAALEAKEPEQ